MERALIRAGLQEWVSLHDPAEVLGGAYDDRDLEPEALEDGLRDDCRNPAGQRGGRLENNVSALDVGPNMAAARVVEDLDEAAHR